ncbi:unnamed protein product [Amoebophrya sp. A120]|nr:unnamed protein product [Amoebophrya sp. A120]|eukprot:GSA120T00009159001.1
MHRITQMDPCTSKLHYEYTSELFFIHFFGVRVVIHIHASDEKLQVIIRDLQLLLQLHRPEKRSSQAICSRSFCYFEKKTG